MSETKSRMNKLWTKLSTDTQQVNHGPPSFEAAFISILRANQSFGSDRRLLAIARLQGVSIEIETD
jgi:hypothetical protein